MKTLIGNIIAFLLVIVLPLGFLLYLAYSLWSGDLASTGLADRQRVGWAILCLVAAFGCLCFFFAAMCEGKESKARHRQHMEFIDSLLRKK